MTDITLRSVKGTSLSHNEMDNNFVASKSGRKNLIINGNAEVWQRGTTITTLGYTADRWYVGSSGYSIVRSTSVPSSNIFSYSLASTRAAATGHFISQFIELPATGKAGLFTSGQKFKFSGWVNGTAGASFQPDLAFSQGSAGPNGTNFTRTESATVLSGSWEFVEFTFTVDQTSGGSDTCLSLLFSYTGTATGETFYFTGIQLELGDVTTDFEHRHLADEITLCQRYYEKSYATSIAPGTLVTAGSKRYQACAAISTGTPTTESFVVEKREIPTVTIYSPNSGSSGKAYNTTSAGDFTAFASLTGTNGFGLSASSAGISDQDLLSYHYTADAEL